MENTFINVLTHCVCLANELLLRFLGVICLFNCDEFVLFNFIFN